MHPITALRRARGLSRLHLSVKAGVSDKTLQRIEVFGGKPSAPVALKLAQALDVPIEMILESDARPVD